MKKLDQFDPGIFTKVAEYLKKKQQEKDKKNEIIIKKIFK
mgnify:CR=1 FL=1